MAYGSPLHATDFDAYRCLSPLLIVSTYDSFIYVFLVAIISSGYPVYRALLHFRCRRHYSLHTNKAAIAGERLTTEGERRKGS